MRPAGPTILTGGTEATKLARAASGVDRRKPAQHRGIAAIGSAAGCGLPLIAIAATAGYLIVAIGFPVLSRRLPHSATAVSTLHVGYPDGRGVPCDVLPIATTRGFAVDEMSAGQTHDNGHAGTEFRPPVEVLLHVHGRGSVTNLAAELAEMPGVHAVVADDVNAASDE